MSSYQLSVHYSAHSPAWAIRCALIAIGRFLLALVGRLCEVVTHFWPHALAGAIAYWLLCNPVVLLALVGIAAYAYITYPRKRVRA